ncbi:MAG: BatA domain-containing protein [Planctomycetes bacterium]|nr:BatA domain-containing protein [Planctomycetota bacterium]
MTFLHPGLALAGLAAVAIPIIIHLLMRRRRRPIMWGAMRFLLEAYRKHKRRLRLEQLLLLATRCLLIACLALALGRPILGAAGLLGGREATTLYLLIDNSLASSATGADGRTALDRHIQLARRTIEQLDSASGDRVALLALGGPAEAIVLPPTSDTSAVRALIEDLAPTDSAMDLTGAAERVRTHFAETEPRQGQAIVLVLSDFLAGSADTDRPLVQLTERDDAVVLASLPAATGVDNVTIESVQPLRTVMLVDWAAAPDATSTSSIRVALRRSGPWVSRAGETHLRVRIIAADGREAATSAEVAWKPGETETTRVVSLSASPSPGRAVVVVEASPDAVAGDDVWRRPIEVRRSLRVAIVAPRRALNGSGLNPNDSADWLRIALSPIVIDRQRFTARETSGEIDVVTIDPGSLDTARLADLDAVFVTHPDLLDGASWSRLRVLADGGGLIVVVPPSGAGVTVWTDAFTSAFDLNWTIGREPREHDPARGLAAERTVPLESDLLAMIAAEFQELSRPVRVWKSLSIAGGSQSGSDAGSRLVELQGGEPFIVTAAPGGDDGTGVGLVVLFASSFGAQWTDLAAQPIFLPLVQEILRQGVGRASGSWTATAGVAFETPAGVVELRNDAGRTVSLAHAVPLRHAGLWRAVDERGVERGLIAVNADPAAGRTDALGRSAARSWLSRLSGAGVRWLADDDATGAAPARDAVSVSEILTDAPDDTKASLPLLIAALLLAALEVALARWFSHATVATSAAKAGAAA